MTEIKGYKVFNHDWTCRNFQYEVGKIFEDDAPLVICKSGFHFCKKAVDCFNYYSFDPNNKVAEVVALGEVSEEHDKCTTNKIQIIREISWLELLNLVNSGKGNTGIDNSGDYNSGDHNRGECNSGDHNSGHCNSGNCNSGDYNSGDYNSGYYNSGNCNSGNYNSGNYNSGDYNSGCFNTEKNTLTFFDKETLLSMKDWINSDAYRIMSKANKYFVFWVGESKMTNEEKEKHPEYKTEKGCFRFNNIKGSFIKWWEALTKDEKQIIKNIPNFDEDKFFEITGIKAK